MSTVETRGQPGVGLHAAPPHLLPPYRRRKRRGHLLAVVAPYKMTQELTHQKPSANRGAIAPNLPKRRHERLTASDLKPLAHSKSYRRRRAAMAVFAGLFLIFGCAPPSIIFSFNMQALKYFAFNFHIRVSPCTTDTDHGPRPN